jgi:hypothetical protein
MEDSRKKRWLPMLGVVVSIIGSMSLLGYLCIRFLPSSGTAQYANIAQRDTPQSRTKEAPAGWTDDTGALAMQPVKRKYILHRDVRRQIGRSIVTYRGKASGTKIKLDVVVLDLDPDVTYSRSIDIVRGKRGFHAGEERFEIIAAYKLRLHVWHYN